MTRKEDATPNKEGGASPENDAGYNENERGKLVPDPETAKKFLETFRPGGPWVLTAIPPEGGATVTQTFSGDAGAAVDWALNQFNQGRQYNVYYAVNPFRAAVTKKATKAEVKAAAYVWADLDPADGESPDAAKARYLAALDTSGLPAPAFVVDSGNGVQALWRLRELFVLPEAIDSPEWDAAVARIEAVNDKLMTALGCHAETRNADRILRLPGSINYPTKAKIKKGRVAVGSALLRMGATSVEFALIEAATGDAKPEPEDNVVNFPGGEPQSGDKAVAPIPGLESYKLKPRINQIIRTATDPNDKDIERGSDPTARRSERTFTVVLALIAAGVSDAVITGLFRRDSPWPIKAHTQDQSNPKHYFEGQLQKAKQKLAGRKRKVDPVEAADNEDVIALVTEMNKDNGLFINSAGQPVIVRTHARWRRVELWQLLGFEEHYRNQTIQIEGQRASVATVWRHHPLRRQFKDVIFAPGETTPPEVFNMWRGWPIIPAVPAPFGTGREKFREHLLNNVCSGDVRLFDFVFAFFAQIVQEPMVKPGVALVLRGDGRIGKTFVGVIFGKLFGVAYVSISKSGHLTGHFNAMIENVLLIQAEEAIWAGDRSAEGVLKDLVTSNVTVIERKGIDPIQVASFVRVMKTSNANWVVPADTDAMRYLVADVAATHANDRPYFKAIQEEMENGGYEALMRDCLAFELSLIDWAKLPKTAALLDQKIESLRAEDKWWFDKLSSGVLPVRVQVTNKPGDHDHDLNGFVDAKSLYDDYLNVTRKIGINHRAIESKVGKYLKPYLRGTSHPKVKIYKRARQEKCVLFKTLAECRKIFEEKLQQPVPDWVDGLREWTFDVWGDDWKE